ncbi:MAG TPA: DUF748 domain-containing protein, partial [Ideonella sp.]|nr:DUF748 domain-containing protein [Ideonella sp.]
LKAIEPGQKLAAVAWRKLLLSDAEIDAAQHRVVLGRLALDQPALRAQRDATGQIDLLQWPLAASSTQAAAAPGPSAQVDASPAWQVQLQELALDGGRVAWQDAAAAKGEVVALELPRLKLSLRDLRWPPPPKGVSPLSGEALVLASGGANASGKLKWQGQLGLQPLAWRGKLSVERFPIHAVAAYAGESSPVSVARAEAGWSGDVSASLLPEGLSLAMKGDARLTDFSVYPRGAMQSARADELLRWNSLELAGVQVAVEPGKVPRIVVGESRLTDFYAQLMVSEAGQFNLTQLGPPEPADAGAPVAAAPPVAAASANAAAAPSPVELAVGGVLLKNGRIDFSDHFVRPNYSAALSDLNGKLGAFRTGTREMATLELRGRVAGTAQLEVRGSLNPTAKPLAMDIQARATDLELAPLSPYAGKYAGYAIERGKLTMDVSYRIDADGRLDAKNQLVLNQLTFGDRIDSPDATKLPVLLAVALLKDRNGVIDLNLPIGGSLNDPQFSIGGLVVKLIVNLLSKALTAPFALLAGGGGDELSLVEFRPGTARMADNASTVIDKVARALADRPSLQMTVNGTADPQSEREAIQAAWLDERLIGERRKEMLRTGGPADAAIPAPSAWPAEERLRLVRRVYGDTKLPNKPRNVLGLAKDISGPEMEALLRASYVVNTDNARELALQRGLAVRAALIAKGLPSDRLFLAAPKLRASGEDDAHWTPRVQLSLGTP